MPTAAAVLSDVVDSARAQTKQQQPQPPLGCAWTELKPSAVRPMDELVSEYYLRFMAVDRPGVLTQISGILGDQDISIASVIQRGRSDGDNTVPLVMRTHAATERNLKTAMTLVDQLPIVQGKSVYVRVEESLG